MESEAYYPRHGHRSASLSSYTPSVVSQMATRLKTSEAELQATRENLEPLGKNKNNKES